MENLGAVFDNIYKNNVWENGGSGWGNNPRTNWRYVNFVHHICEGKRVLDVGCGDLKLWELRGVPGAHYTGIDVSEEVIGRITSDFESVPNQDAITCQVRCTTLQQCSYLIKDVDVILVKDVMQHLPNGDITAMLMHLIWSRKTVVISNEYDPDYPSNPDIEAGECRPLKLMREPFGVLPQYSFLWHADDRPTYLKQLVVL